MLFIETSYFTRFCEEHCTDTQADLNAVQRKMLMQWVNEVLDDE